MFESQRNFIFHAFYSNLRFYAQNRINIKVTNNNKLTDQNITNIVNEFTTRAEAAHFAHLASYDEIVQNDYNLSVSTYVEAEDTREFVDIVKLNAELKEIIAREQVLREEIDRIIAEIEG